MKRITLLLIGFVLLSASYTGWAQSLVINEVITSNSTVITDEDDSYEDWIELYNGTGAAINLEGYGLTDNATLFQWVFPAKEILPGQHLLVWCSGKDKTDPAQPLHTNFKISADGETITLTAVGGTMVDAYAPIIIPQNYSYGRQPDGSATFVIFTEPTPGTANITQGYSEILAAPSFSQASGFYEDSFLLALTSTSPGATILYTTDGSDPDENNLSGTTYQYKNVYPQNPGDPFGPFLQNSFITKSYTVPIMIQDRSNLPNKISAISSTFDADASYYLPDFPVAKSTVVRAKVIKTGALASKTVTRNYFITDEGNDWFSLPVASLSFDEDQLFGYTDGIYVAGAKFDNWRTTHPNSEPTYGDTNYEADMDEIVGNFTYTVDGAEVINQNVGMVIHGGYSKKFPIKTLRLYARSEYGKSSFDYPFFEGNDNDSFDRLLLRNSGNDYSSTYFRDAFIQTSVKHLHFPTQSYQPTVTFINGEYWGMLNLRERYDKKYFEKIFDINEDELDHLELAGGVEAKEGDTVHYDNLMAYVTANSLAVPANYAHVLTQLDPVNYADYFIAQIYINNNDWPGNNVELFRKKTAAYEPEAPYGHDGRWRWIMKDTDFGLGLWEPYTENSLADATATDGPVWPNPAWSTLLFRKMLENAEFKNYFISRFADLMNTTFLPERLEDIYTGMKNNIADEMPGHIDRWSFMQGSVNVWNTNCSNMINFAFERPAHQRNHIMQKFNITGTVDATLDVSDNAHGYVKINTIDINPSTPGVTENPYPWSGIYYHNIPVTLKAVALPGYQFSHWTGSVTGTEAEVTITPTVDFSVTAHFIPAVVIPVQEPIYFWMFDGDVPNDAPLSALDATFETQETGTAVLDFQSCLVGYPFDSTHASWRKASMERRNSPTEINYIPEANDDLPFAESGMKAIQIKQPFQNGGLENTMVFSISTAGFKDIVFGFAAKDEGAASSLIADYSIDGGASWVTTDMQATSLELTGDYALYKLDFATAESMDDNTAAKIRLRFAGEDMTADDGNRVTFNNVSVKGISLTSDIPENEKLHFTVYPNPVSDVLTILHDLNAVSYSIYSIDGKLVKSGMSENNSINMESFEQGIYLLKLKSEDNQQTIRIIKK